MAKGIRQAVSCCLPPLGGRIPTRFPSNHQLITVVIIFVFPYNCLFDGLRKISCYLEFHCVLLHRMICLRQFTSRWTAHDQVNTDDDLCLILISINSNGLFRIKENIAKNFIALLHMLAARSRAHRR